MPFTKELVTVIVPTTHDRFEFNERIVRQFHAQDYQNKSLLLSYSDEVVGEKRNQLCKAATGSIILHMDSDDYYASDWITKSVYALIASGADAVGLSDFNFYDTVKEEGWHYQYLDIYKPYVAGATMCYWKRFWEEGAFESVNVGEDCKFAWKDGASVFAHGYEDGFTASIHGSNTSEKKLVWPHYTRMGVEEEMKVKLMIHNCIK